MDYARRLNSHETFRLHYKRISVLFSFYVDGCLREETSAPLLGDFDYTPMLRSLGDGILCSEAALMLINLLPGD